MTCRQQYPHSIHVGIIVCLPRCDPQLRAFSCRAYLINISNCGKSHGASWASALTRSDLEFQGKWDKCGKLADGDLEFQGKRGRLANDERLRISGQLDGASGLTLSDLELQGKCGKWAGAGQVEQLASLLAVLNSNASGASGRGKGQVGQDLEFQGT